MDEDESLRVIFNLRTALRQYAPRFCKYVKSIHLFEMKGWSNITDLVKTDEITAPVDVPDPKQRKKPLKPKKT